MYYQNTLVGKLSKAYTQALGVGDSACLEEEMALLRANTSRLATMWSMAVEATESKTAGFTALQQARLEAIAADLGDQVTSAIAHIRVMAESISKIRDRAPEQANPTIVINQVIQRVKDGEINSSEAVVLLEESLTVHAAEALTTNLTPSIVNDTVIGMDKTIPNVYIEQAIKDDLERASRIMPHSESLMP